MNTYRLLVPHEKYPEWESRPVKALGKHTDLYTSVWDGSAVDTFEKWLKCEIEDPAAQPLEKLRAGGVLTREEWGTLGMFMAALDVRTPAAFLRMQAIWTKVVPQAMETAFDRLEMRLERARRTGNAPEPPADSTDAIPVRVTKHPSDQEGKISVKAEVVQGRELWIYEIRRLLKGIADIWRHHTWATLRPHPGSEWFTTDDPVVRLHSHIDGKFDFGGGWGRKDVEHYCPISPNIMVYTKIGAKVVEPEVCSPELTLTLQRMIATHAFRWVFARGEPMRATMFRPRLVDLDMFSHEESVRRDWHESQSRAVSPQENSI